MKLKQHEIRQFQKKVWDFYRKNRRDLPWRPPLLKLQKDKTGDFYKILISEIMLQQTQVSRVLEKYQLFMKAFPDFDSLANTTVTDVLKVWQGLGYNRRALYLKSIAEKVLNQHKGILPNDPQILQNFKGIGHATARSIVVFAFNKPEVFIETNIRRVFIHTFYSSRKERKRRLEKSESSRLAALARTISDAELYPLVAQTLDQANPREWYYGLMDYGTYLAKVVTNPNRKSTHYAKQSKFEGSLRQVRGRILKILLQHQSLSINELKKEVGATEEYFQKALDQLHQEKFIDVTSTKVKILS